MRDLSPRVQGARRSPAADAPFGLSVVAVWSSNIPLVLVLASHFANAMRSLGQRGIVLVGAANELGQVLVSHLLTPANSASTGSRGVGLLVLEP